MPIRIAASPGRGLGLFALSSLKAGAEVFSEAPLAAVRRAATAPLAACRCPQCYGPLDGCLCGACGPLRAALRSDAWQALEAPLLERATAYPALAGRALLRAAFAPADDRAALLSVLKAKARPAADSRVEMVSEADAAAVLDAVAALADDGAAAFATAPLLEELVGVLHLNTVRTVADEAREHDAACSAMYTMASFMNHDEASPTCGVRFGDGGAVVHVEAVRDVAAGDELTIDYAGNDEELRKSLWETFGIPGGG